MSYAIKRPALGQLAPDMVSKAQLLGIVGMTFVAGAFVGGLVTHMYHDKAGNLRWNGRRRGTRRRSRR